MRFSLLSGQVVQLQPRSGGRVAILWSPCLAVWRNGLWDYMCPLPLFGRVLQSLPLATMYKRQKGLYRSVSVSIRPCERVEFSRFVGQRRNWGTRVAPPAVP